MQLGKALLQPKGYLLFAHHELPHEESVNCLDGRQKHVRYGVKTGAREHRKSLQEVARKWYSSTLVRKTTPSFLAVVSKSSVGLSSCIAGSCIICIVTCPVNMSYQSDQPKPE